MASNERTTSYLTATVTDVLTTGFAEVAIDGEDESSGEKVRHIAIFNKEQKIHRGDVVELMPFDPREVKEARIAYILPLIVFIFGFLVTNKLQMGERILSGLILAFMTFVVSWLMNRRARLLKRQEYKITRIIKEDPNHI